MELAEAQAWLEGLINIERTPELRTARLDLAAIRALLGRVGHPERSLPVLHIAGSKGKGSTALLAEALLRADGRTVGTYTSPHFVRWTERFRIDGREAEEAALARVLTRLRPEVEALRTGPAVPSFFDATTAAAFLLFAEAGVDVAILEVGLGGRLDSTNACEPRVTAVTSIELEHTDRLGTTRAAIAAEKAGIAKPGVPLVVGRVGDEAAAAIEAAARKAGAPLCSLGVDFDAGIVASSADGSRFRFRDGAFEAEVHLGVPGAHQVDNAAVAWACVRRLHGCPPGRRDPTGVAPALEAFGRVRLPGRVESLERVPRVVIDGAHTEASAEALAQVLERLPRRKFHLVLSVSAGKEILAICRRLASDADTVTVTRAEPLRSMDPEALAEIVARVAPRARVRVVADPAAAVTRARGAMSDRDLLCATGSVYMAGAARNALGAR